MTSFRSLQRDFQEHVLDGSDAIAEAIIDGPRIDARARLAIYARGYRSRLLEVLAADFPALHALAGDDMFAELGRAYIAAHPSRHPNARELGRELAGFLGRAAPYASHPVLCEMAWLEWAMGEAFYAIDDVGLDMADLSATLPQDWPQVRFRLRNSFRHLSLAWNVAAFRTAVDEDADPPAPERWAQAEDWIAWRPALTVRYRRLDADEAVALLALRAGGNFAQMCEALADSSPPGGIAPRMAGLLARWVGEGLLARY